MQVFRTRLGASALFWLVVWPLLAVVAATVELCEHPLTREIPVSYAVGGALAGVVYLLPQMLVCGILLALATVLVWRLLTPAVRSGPVYVVQAGVSFFALVTGIAFCYPALLHYPLLRFVRGHTVIQAYAVVAVVLLAAAVMVGVRTGLRGVVGSVAAMAVFMALGLGLASLPAPGSGHRAHANVAAILGLDSLSQADDLRPLRELARTRGGTYYERAVTPGLLTNSVWPSILMHRPPHETGVLFTYQSPNWSRSSFQLVREAKRQGYGTWSFFRDEFTTYVGTLGGFDHNGSGPMGWLQMATSVVKNGSVLLPVLLPRLPAIPLAQTPRNQEGTFAYSLRGEVREILTAGEGSRPALVAGHIDYLHHAAYPRYADLTPAERNRVLHAKVDAVQDFSLHWQYPEIAGDPIGLYDWKMRHLQEAVAQELAATGFLDAGKNNRLIIFSDHGRRVGLKNDNFGQPQYYNVPLVTFGVPPRDPAAPISVVDISALLGFPDSSRPAATEPVVEYTNFATMEAWKHAMSTATFDRSGRLELRPDVVARQSAVLAAYRPYGPTAGYSPAAAPGNSAANLR